VGDCECSSGCTCNYECQGPRCETQCLADSACAITAAAETDTSVRCRRNSSCELDCADDASCDLICGGGECILRCDTTGVCRMRSCAEMRDCGGGVIACNRPCP